MHAYKFSATQRTALVTLSLAMMLAGCKSKPAATDDSSLTTQVQAALTADRNLGGQSIQASVVNGVVTLNGNVSSDTVRTIANQDVAEIVGVRTVIDNLIVNSPGSNAPASAMAQPAPVNSAKGKKPSAIVSKSAPALPQAAPIVRNTPAAPPAPQPPPPAVVAQAQPPQPPQPPAPVVHSITLSPGFGIPVRITQTLDSASSQTGDKFTGVIASDIVVDGMVVLPQGTPVTGHVDDVKDAAHFKGSSLLSISLSSITRKGEHINIATDPYTKEGEGRGKNTAEKVGGGAAVGAILGGIFGGGKGAAIGAAAGGGVGTAAQGVTRGQQVQIPSETVVRFTLSETAIVHVTTNTSENSDAPLVHHTDQ